MEDSLIYLVSNTIDGTTGYSDAVRSLNKKLKLESSPEGRAEEIFDKLVQFYSSREDEELHEVLTPTGEACLDKTVNLITMYQLNGIKSRQFIPDDLSLYHTTAALVDEKGRAIKHLEPTSKDGFNYNLFAGKEPKGTVLDYRGTSDTIKCQKASSGGNDYISDLSILGGIIGGKNKILNAYHIRGKLFYDNNHFDKAKNDFKKIIKKVKRCPEAHLSLGLTFQKLGKNPKGSFIKAKKEALALLEEYPIFKEEFDQIVQKAGLELQKIELAGKLKKKRSFF